MMFSVIIPLYNKASYIQRALNSVFAQTNVDFEVIVIDDGSTDSSSEIVCAYSDARIRLIRQANGGVSAARNRGIAEAKGKWITFLDADDEYLPEFLHKVRKCAKRFPTAGVVFARAAYKRGGTHVNVARDRVSGPRLLSDYLHFVVFENGYEIHSSAVAVKSGVFHTAGTFPVGIKLGEDLDMWLRLALTTEIAYIPEFLSIYHMDAGGSNWQEHLDQEPYVIGTYHQWLAAGRIPRHLLKSSEAYIQTFILAKSIRHAIRGNRAEARRILFGEVKWLVAPKRYLVRTIVHAFVPIQAFRRFRHG